MFIVQPPHPVHTLSAHIARTLTTLRLPLPLLLTQLDLQDPQTTRQVVLFPLDRHLELVQVVRHELLFRRV
jgi:hypothetical protein